MKYKLFIDDERYPTTPDWFVARSSYDAIYAVTNYGMPTEIAFDHDLRGDDTAMVFIKWLEGKLLDGEILIPDLFSFSVHSQNPIGSRNISNAMDSLIKHF